MKNIHTQSPPTTFTGGCACGAIRYEATSAPLVMLQCHCRDCQRSSGGGFSSYVVVPRETFRLTRGALRFHALPSEVGGVTRRGFCADCGTPIVSLSDAAAEIAALRPASLDDPSWFSPQIDVWTTDAHSWDRMDPALPKFPKYPSAESEPAESAAAC